MSQSIEVLASEIVRKVRDSMGDSTINQETVVANIIRERIAQLPAAYQSPWWHVRNKFESHHKPDNTP